MARHTGKPFHDDLPEWWKQKFQILIFSTPSLWSGSERPLEVCPVKFSLSLVYFSSPLCCPWPCMGCSKVTLGILVCWWWGLWSERDEKRERKREREREKEAGRGREERRNKYKPEVVRSRRESIELLGRV